MYFYIATFVARNKFLFTLVLQDGLEILLKGKEWKVVNFFTHRTIPYNFILPLIVMSTWGEWLTVVTVTVLTTGNSCKKCQIAHKIDSFYLHVVLLVKS